MAKNLLIIFILFEIGLSYGKEIFDQVKLDRKIFYIGIPALTISFLLDDEIYDLVKNNQSDLQDRLWKNITHLGSPFIVGAGILGYGYGYFSKNEKLAKASMLAVQSATVSAFIVLPLKYITGRERPSQEDSLSFPSAHSAIAFAFWGSYASVYEESRLKYIFYTIPVMVAYSRLYLEKHWLSDVVAGGIIGLSSIYIAKKLTNFLSIRYNMTIFIDISSQKTGILYFF